MDDKAQHRPAETGGKGGGMGRSLTSRPIPTVPSPSIVSSAALPSPALPARIRNDPGRSPLSTGEVHQRPQPAVYWNDKKSSDLPRTFFDDLTPPGSPSDVAGSHNGASLGYPSTATGSIRKETGYDYSYDRVAPPAPLPTKERRWGLKRWTLWALVAAACVVIVALAVGLGVGLSSHNRNLSNREPGDSKGADATSTASSTTTSKHATSTSSKDTATATSTTKKSTSTVCPAANNTEYDVPGSDKTFLRFCGRDMSADGAKDLAVVWTASIEDCMINCAGYDGCTACSWGALPGDDYRDNHRCFLKNHLGKAKKARDGWDFAMLK